MTRPRASHALAEPCVLRPRHAWWTTLATLLILCVQPASADPDAGAGTAVARNLFVTDCLRTTVTAMLARSASFRAQMAAIGSTRRLGVAIAVGPDVSGPPASAVIRRTSEGAIFAVVTIRARSHSVELIAHELEHVLEQVDRVALHKMVLARDGAWHVGGGFETERAIEAGRRVAREVGML